MDFYSAKRSLFEYKHFLKSRAMVERLKFKNKGDRIKWAEGRRVQDCQVRKKKGEEKKTESGKKI